jgi:Tfp pilus assembly protein PilZ
MNSIAKSYIKTHSKRPPSKDSGVKDNSDPRKYPRKPYLKSVFFNCRDQTYEGLIINISRGGVFIETADQFFFGQSIELVISNTRIDRGKRVQGWIVHLGKTGMGVTFKRIFERRSGSERRNEIDRRTGADRRKRHKRKNRRKKGATWGPIMNYHT